MPNELDETDVSTINTAGRDVHVIDKKVGVTLDGTDKFMYVFAWCMFVIPGLIFMTRVSKARNYFQQLQQKIQHAASTIDNYQLQRVTILQNTAKLIEKAVDLDKDTFTDIAKLRANAVEDDNARIALAQQLQQAQKSINVAFENYPDLKAHKAIADAMQQNSYLQQEITAAREIYNDAVLRWNTEIFQQWAKKRAAAQAGYTSRIPFILAADIKEQSQGVFF
ncbi:MAG: LemA family protein [Bacilli bacterium]|nr:LemA family protein [Bacilli bacterium]